jgi:hypothetical protein
VLLNQGGFHFGQIALLYNVLLGSGLTGSRAAALEQAAKPEDDRPLVLLHHLGGQGGGSRGAPDRGGGRRDLEADAEAEGEGDDDHEPGQGGQQPPADPDPVLGVVSCKDGSQIFLYGETGGGGTRNIASSIHQTPRRKGTRPE